MVSKEQESANFSNKSSENSESSVFATLWAILSLGPLHCSQMNCLGHVSLKTYFKKYRLGWTYRLQVPKCWYHGKKYYDK